MPASVSTTASAINNPTTVRGRAPTERRTAFSRRRSLSVVRIMVTMPSRAVATTMAETALSAVSAVPMSPHSSCRAAPGKIADRGSSPYSLMARCSRKVASLNLRPRRAAVIALGLAGDAAAALPVDVDGLDGFQAHVHRAIDRRPSLLEDAADAERLVLMLHERDGTEPVRDDDGIANSIAQGGGHIGADQGKH